MLCCVIALHDFISVAFLVEADQLWTSATMPIINLSQTLQAKKKMEMLCLRNSQFYFLMGAGKGYNSMVVSPRRGAQKRFHLNINEKKIEISLKNLYYRVGMSQVIQKFHSTKN